MWIILVFIFSAYTSTAPLSLQRLPVFPGAFPTMFPVRPFLLQNATTASLISPISFAMVAYSKPLLQHFYNHIFLFFVMRTPPVEAYVSYPPLLSHERMENLEVK